MTIKFKLSDDLKELAQLAGNLEIEYNVGNLTSAFEVLEKLIDVADTIRSKFDE